MRLARAGLLAALPAASMLLSGATALPGTPAPAIGSLQEAEVTGLLVDGESKQPVVVLQGKRDGRRFVMAIGPFEATGIAVPLRGVTPPRPLTHDLVLNLLGGLRAELRRVVITDLREGVYYALLHLEVQGAPLEFDSRPSDAIALALRAKVPILVEDRVFEKAERPHSGRGATPHF